MTDTSTHLDAAAQAPVPNPDLKPLDRLVGTWNLSGDAEGTVSYAWMDGGFFLIQHVNITLFGHRVKGIEIIGHMRPYGEQPSADIRSRAYDNDGNTLDYGHEVNADELTIWGGEKGSPAYYKSQFSPDGNTNVAAFVYPDGGTSRR